DKIASIVTTDDQDLNLFTFGNVDHSRILGFSLENSLVMDRWKASLGATYLGESTEIDESTDSNSDYLWSFTLQSSLSHTLPKLNTTVSALLKYNGRTQVILEGTDGPVVGQTDGLTGMVASARPATTRTSTTTFGAGTRLAGDRVTPRDAH